MAHSPNQPPSILIRSAHTFALNVFKHTHTNSMPTALRETLYEYVISDVRAINAKARNEKVGAWALTWCAYRLFIPFFFPVCRTIDACAYLFPLLFFPVMCHGPQREGAWGCLVGVHNTYKIERETYSVYNIVITYSIFPTLPLPAFPVFLVEPHPSDSHPTPLNHPPPGLFLHSASSLSLSLSVCL